MKLYTVSELPPSVWYEKREKYWNVRGVRSAGPLDELGV